MAEQWLTRLLGARNPERDKALTLATINRLAIALDNMEEKHALLKASAADKKLRGLDKMGLADLRYATQLETTMEHLRDTQLKIDAAEEVLSNAELNHDVVRTCERLARQLQEIVRTTPVERAETAQEDLEDAIDDAAELATEVARPLAAATTVTINKPALAAAFAALPGPPIPVKTVVARVARTPQLLADSS
jgi:hypothetical protein